MGLRRRADRRRARALPHTYAEPGTYDAKLTIRSGDTVISTATQQVRVFEKLEGTLDTTPPTATPFVNDDATIDAKFTPAGAQSAAGRDVTFQVFRKSELSGAAYPRVKNEVVQTGRRRRRAVRVPRRRARHRTS